MIYRTKVINWENLVVRKVAENKMTLLKDEGAYSWRFNEKTNRIIDDVLLTSSGSSTVINTIIQELGLEGVVYVARIEATPIKPDIIGSLVQSV